jgi:hypothetical protein
LGREVLILLREKVRRGKTRAVELSVVLTVQTYKMTSC